MTTPVDVGSGPREMVNPKHFVPGISSRYGRLTIAQLSLCYNLFYWLLFFRIVCAGKQTIVELPDEVEKVK